MLTDFKAWRVWFEISSNIDNQLHVCMFIQDHHGFKLKSLRNPEVLHDDTLTMRVHTRPTQRIQSISKAGQAVITTTAVLT